MNIIIQSDITALKLLVNKPFHKLYFMFMSSLYALNYQMVRL